MLISVHIPKCGGTTFDAVLERLYGRALWRVYGEIQRPEDIRPEMVPRGVACIHGHFRADTFDSLFPGAPKITWLRDPLERMVSSYLYYLRYPNPRDPISAQLHRNRFDLEAFAAEVAPNALTGMLADQPLKAFTFVGIVEDYETSLRRFYAWAGVEEQQNVASSNVNVRRGGRYYNIDPRVRERMAAANEKDIAFYSAACMRAGAPVRGGDEEGGRAFLYEEEYPREFLLLQQLRARSGRFLCRSEQQALRRQLRDIVGRLSRETSVLVLGDGTGQVAREVRSVLPESHVVRGVGDCGQVDFDALGLGQGDAPRYGLIVTAGFLEDVVAPEVIARWLSRLMSAGGVMCHLYRVRQERGFESTCRRLSDYTMAGVVGRDVFLEDGRYAVRISQSQFVSAFNDADLSVLHSQRVCGFWEGMLALASSRPERGLEQCNPELSSSRSAAMVLIGLRMLVLLTARLMELLGKRGSTAGDFPQVYSWALRGLRCVALWACFPVFAGDARVSTVVRVKGSHS
jgi:hypothetical protein